MNQLFKRDVPKGARILAGVILVINLFLVAGVLLFLRDPELIRESMKGMALFTEEELQALRAEIPMQLVMSGMVIIGLLLIIFKNTWGYILYAIPPVITAFQSLLMGDLGGVGQSLLGVVVMGLLIFLPRREPLRMERQENASNYSYNIPPRPEVLPKDDSTESERDLSLSADDQDKA